MNVSGRLWERMEVLKLGERIIPLLSAVFPKSLSFYIDRYTWVLNLLLLVLIGWAAARVTSNAMRAHFARPAQVEAWKHPLMNETAQAATHSISMETIEKRNLFKAKLEEVSKNEAAEVAIVPLDIVIQGIIIGPGWAFATVRDNKGGKSKVLKVGEEFQPGVRLAGMDKMKVVFQRANGAFEEFPLNFVLKGSPKKPVPPGSASSEPPAGPDYGKDVRAISETEYVIDKNGFQAALQNINELITQARLTPAFTPDRQVEGFRVFSVKQGSLFQKLGLRNGDVIQRVNGTMLDDARKGLELFQTLKDQSHFTIDLKRGNEKKTFNYDVR